jgi:hypothetical protein
MASRNAVSGRDGLSLALIVRRPMVGSFAQQGYGWRIPSESPEVTEPHFEDDGWMQARKPYPHGRTAIPFASSVSSIDRNR